MRFCFVGDVGVRISRDTFRYGTTHVSPSLSFWTLILGLFLAILALVLKLYLLVCVRIFSLA